MKVPFFKPFITGKETKYVAELIKKGQDVGGDGYYTSRVHEFLQTRYGVPKVFLTTSGTTALELAVRILKLERGSQVIVPSFTFSSTVNAVLLNNGLKVVFVEIDPQTLCLDPGDLERKITPQTKAVIVVHYAGISCDMDKIVQIARKHHLTIIEDAAQCIESKYKNQFLGTIGDLGCISFHETKNVTSGEGGALFINSNNKKLIEKAEIFREKGTNRSKFFRGEVDKYTWIDLGSSVLPSDILAAFLLAQLEAVEKITNLRLKIYKFYQKSLAGFEKEGLVKLPSVPAWSTHNAHIFYLLFKTAGQRNFALKYLRKHGVGATFHYIPLHSSPMGKRLGYRKSDLPITEKVSQTLVRLPLYAGMKKEESGYVIKKVEEALNLIKKRNFKNYE